MDAAVVVHVTGGGLALASGYLALFAAKGSRLHRRGGTVFVGAMLVMTTVGLGIAAGRNIAPAINVPAALLTAYLVVTALLTVRPPATKGRTMLFGAMLIALGGGLTSMAIGFAAVARGEFAFPLFLFGVIGVLAAVGDIRLLRHRVMHGPRRLVRHLWRMCVALLIAALSFFIGQADEFPESMRIMPLLALPMLIVLAAMIYWLWRLRARGNLPARAG
jgi:uncharacterized membrane protein